MKRLDKELKEILKMVSAISKIDILLGTILSIIILIFNIYYGIAFIGTIVAIINFAVNALVINRSFNSKKGSTILIQVSYIIRMVVIVGIAYLFRHDYKTLLFYMTGLIFHQVAMFIYSKRKEKISINIQNKQ